MNIAVSQSGRALAVREELSRAKMTSRSHRFSCGDRKEKETEKGGVPNVPFKKRARRNTEVWHWRRLQGELR